MIFTWIYFKNCSNVSYHGDLEKKAAMEQKRNLTGEETNGHDDSGSGTNRHYSLDVRKKRAQQVQQRLQPVVAVAKPHDSRRPPVEAVAERPAFLSTLLARKRKPIVRGKPLKIPGVFIIKPAPPFKLHRTGKKWSMKGGPAKPRRVVVKSYSDSHVNNRLSAILGVYRPPRRRYSNSGDESDEPRQLRPSRHSMCRPALTGCCSHCLADVLRIIQIQDECPSNSMRSRLLSDFLITSPFQHIILCK